MNDLSNIGPATALAAGLWFIFSFLFRGGFGNFLPFF